MSALCKLTTVVLGALGLALLAPAVTRGAGGPSERRTALVEQAAKELDAVSALSAALKDENLVVRRTAARLLADLGPPARPALAEALDNSDFLVRRAALWAVCDPLSAEALPYLTKALKDPHPVMRLTAINLLVQLQPRTQPVTELLNQARQDDSPAVRNVAAQALWPFHKEPVSVRDRKDWDHDIKVVQTIPIPKEGWRFKTDPKTDGHLQKWYEPGFDDASWFAIAIEVAWEKQGHEYDGVAWYRGGFELPAKPDHLAVEIRFEAVDECAWVWLNGQYVGQHDIGPEGWDKPFTLDITKEVKWGQKNQITVRVHDSAYAGGIWKPVKIEVLK
ncbi:MAG: hypothetical protein FJ279_12625 [Planctomycetes bacterium]|nr:hypothetical protein [Planctomycetota bacterium]